ncbi:hypothetical protein [Propionivibrio sp.]|uniref:hypothetical protein n=1 Tax=Propionivibrio sp. TaxID=2212460 RepID=UPI0039E505EF
MIHTGAMIASVPCRAPRRTRGSWLPGRSQAEGTVSPPGACHSATAAPLWSTSMKPVNTGMPPLRFLLNTYSKRSSINWMLTPRPYW